MGVAALTSPLVEARNLGVRRGDRWVLKDLSLQVRAGELTFLLGGNGRGKSTFINALCGLTRPAAGSLSLAGEPWPAEPMESGCVAAVLDDVSQQFLGGTVEEELDLAAAWAPSPVAGFWDALFRKLGLDFPAPAQPVQTLSGGEQVRLLIALAVVRRPRVLILDDPFAALGWPETGPLLDLLRSLVRRGDVESVIASTTEVEIAVRGDRVAVLHEGSAVLVGAPEVLGDAPAVEGLQRPLQARCREALGLPPEALQPDWWRDLL